jgi:putative membrane protein
MGGRAPREYPPHKRTLKKEQMKIRLTAVAVSLGLAVSAAAQAADDVPQAGAFSDAEIVGALQAADQGEMEAGDLGVEKAARSDVKSYAAKMKKEHASHLERLNRVASEQGITGAESEFSSGLRRHSTEMNGALRPLSGADFDRAYIDGMVADHQALLDAIDERFIPSAKNDKLRSELRRTRSAVNEHLRDARRIQSRIAGGKSNAASDGERAVGPQEGRYPEAGRFRDPSKYEEVTNP